MSLFAIAGASLQASRTQHVLLPDTWLSIVGGGLVAAIVTTAFNVWWDRQKQRRAEDWEYRRHRANLIHMASQGLMEVYFAAKTEIDFLVGTLGMLVFTLRQLEAEADQLVGGQSGPRLTVAQLEQGKTALLQPFQQYNRQQVDMRWNQYELKMKELEAKAQEYINMLQPLVPEAINMHVAQLFTQLSADYEWNLENAEQRLALFNECLPGFQQIQRDLAGEMEIQLGRRKRPK